MVFGDDAFAHAGLSGDEDVGLGARDVLNEAPHPLHPGSLEEEAVGVRVPGPQVLQLRRILLEGLLKGAVLLLDGVDLLHGDGIKAHLILELVPAVKERHSHGEHIHVRVVDLLGGGDLALLPDDGGGDTGVKDPLGLQLEGRAPHNGALGKAEAALIILADIEDGALRIAEHHLVGQHQIVFRGQDGKEVF